MLTIDPKQIARKELHAYMLGAVAPRPICFASTIDENGIPNLAPYSFFNAFSSNPPILVFSSNRRNRDNTTKDTYANIKKTRQVVINVVSYKYVRKMALASIEYPNDVNEFEKAGFTQLESEMVKPFRVAESPVQMECEVRDIIELGKEGGAGNLFLCKIVLMHVDEAVLDQHGKIDPQKIDLCGRMGAKLYCRASGDAIFEILQPVNKIGIGFDQLPDRVKNSKVLTGNELAQLASVESLPSKTDIEEFAQGKVMEYLQRRFTNDKESFEWHLHEQAAHFIREGDLPTAWKVLLQA